MSAVTSPGQHSVLDVLERLDQALENVQHVVVLGSGNTPLASKGDVSGNALDVAYAIGTSLNSAAIHIPGDSARCLVNTLDHSFLVYFLGTGLTVVLIGPPQWNIVLTSRRVEPLLAAFVDAYLAEMQLAHRPQQKETRSERRDRGRGARGLPQRRRSVPLPTTTRAAPPAEEGTAEPRTPESEVLAAPGLIRDVDLLSRVLKGLGGLS